MKIAILSRSPFLYSTQSLVEAAERQNHEVTVLDHTRCQLLLEQEEAYIFYEGMALPRQQAIIPRIGASVTPLGATVIRHFEMLDAYTLIQPEALLQTRHKMRCLQQLAQAGIPIPKTAMVHNSNDVSRILTVLGGMPIIVKLTESTHGSGVILIKDHLTAQSAIDAFLRMDKEVMVQEFVSEAEGSDIRAIVVGGKIVAAMRRQAQEGEFRSNMHLGASAEKIWLSPKEQQLVKKVVRILKLDVAGVDLLQSKRGPLVLEVNASPGLEGIEQVTGEDVAGAIIRHLERQVKKRHPHFQQRLR